MCVSRGYPFHDGSQDFDVCEGTCVGAPPACWLGDPPAGAAPHPC